VSFSERYGYKTKKLVELEAVDEQLTNGLWNAITEHIWNYYSIDSYTASYVNGSTMQTEANLIWQFYFKKPTDEIPTYWEDCLQEIKTIFYSNTWNEKLDFVEFMIGICDKRRTGDLIKLINFHFRQENSGYSVIDESIVPISNNEEVEEVEKAAQLSDKYGEVSTHIKTALGHLSDRDDPDYRNSVKESISAVEAISKVITGKSDANLSGALKVLEENHGLNGVLKQAYTKLYGYTSSTDGVRHALMDETQINEEEARLMLVICSAFTNYLAIKNPL